MKENILENYQKEVSDSIDKTLEKVRKEKKERHCVSLVQYTQEKIKKEIAAAFVSIAGLKDIYAREISLELPPSHVPGDLSLSCFNFIQKSFVKDPAKLSDIIAGSITSREGEFIQKARAVGPFVNLELDKKRVFAQVLEEIDFLKEAYGESGVNAGKVAVIDYSGPNIGKTLGIGHLRSTIIGQVLSNLYWKTGYIVVKDNHLGDGGTQLGALAYACQLWGAEGKNYSLEEYKDLYVRFTREAKQNPELKQYARELFHRLEEGDPEMLAFWKKVWDESAREFNSLYEKLGVSFDTCIGEIYYTDSSREVAQECLEKNICRVEEKTGSVVADSLENVPSFLLRKEDGSTLYLTRDAATIKFRMKTFHPEIMVYVVGQEQELHFKQLFALSRAMGYLTRDDQAKHVSFGMITVGGKKMSTRGGTLIELREILLKSVDASRQIIHKKNPELSLKEIEEVASIVGVGAIIYNDLRQSRIKNISFDWDRMLSFEEGSAVYLQYTCVRVKSILEKIETLYPGESVVSAADIAEIIFETKAEFLIARHLMNFPEIIIHSQACDSPHHICLYLEELAGLFNRFYNEVSIIKTEDEYMRKSRILLSRSTAQVLKNGLFILNIRVPNKM